MLAVAIASIIGVAGIIMLILWHRWRQLDRRINRLAARLNKFARSGRRRNWQKGRHMLQDIYGVINTAMAEGNSAALYHAIDLLKLALGEGILREDEPIHLMSVAVAALQAKQPNTAGMILDAFRPMLRCLPKEHIPAVTEQLTIIGAVALKEKQYFLVSKATDNILAILERADCSSERAIVQAAFRALKVMGAIAVRRRDPALFREITGRAARWFINNANYDLTAEIVPVLNVWLHRIVKSSDLVIFDIFYELIKQLSEADVWSDEAINLLFPEWINLAGIACLDPNSSLAVRIIETMPSLIASSQSLEYWTLVVNGAGQTAKLAVSHHGLKNAFPVVFPLLEMGRRYLVAELKFGEYADGFRQRVLYKILKECLMLITFIARQDMTITPGDVIAEVYQLWLTHPLMTANPKSAKKFCQLLLLFWGRIRRRQAKRYTPANKELFDPELISEKEKKLLEFLDG